MLWANSKNPELLWTKRNDPAYSWRTVANDLCDQVFGKGKWERANSLGNHETSPNRVCQVIIPGHISHGLKLQAKPSLDLFFR
jgi:hypothetical protein